MKFARASGLLTLALMLPHAAATATRTELASCRLPGLDEPARCGTLDVPENPQEPNGRKVTLAFAVITATGDNPVGDPIVPLYGGPGEEVISDAGRIARQFADLRERRDILLVDQRGTGRSGALRCRLFDASAPGRSLQDFLPVARVAGCARELSSGADLTQYSYRHFVSDLEHIRGALGYSRYNLFAGSYGTRAAQVYVRDFSRGVRTVLLHSVVPLDVITPLAMAKASQSQFDETFSACEKDAACKDAYPALRAEFTTVLERLASGSVRASIPGAADATLGRGRAVEWLRGKLYRPASAADLPWLIHRAYRGDWTPFIEGILEQAREVDAAYALGLWLSITCSDDVAFLREAEIAPATAGTYLGDYRVREQQAACRTWPRTSVPSGDRVPVRSDVPAMFVSGDLDAASPLSFTARVAPGFSNRVEIISRGQGHTEWNDCAGRLYGQFVESGTAEGIDSACPPIPRPAFRLPDERSKR